jgi:nicotinamidase-related amidase
MKVLIVVDVQNCFMYNNEDKSQPKLNLNEKNQSKEIAAEIADLTDANDLVVFTRDFHPINHISFAGDEGRAFKPPVTWPHHCRNEKRICLNRTKNETKPILPSSVKKPINSLTDFKINELMPDDKKTKIMGEVINGTELSYFFYETRIGEIAYDLNVQNREGYYKIGLGYSSNGLKIAQSENVNTPATQVDSKNDTNQIEQMNYNVVPYRGKYVTLTKGERCNQEAYSAFNYHIEYIANDPANPGINANFDPLQRKNSTGLWEWILLQATNRQEKEIEITVCGLVGNVCVMHTLLQGRGLWEKVYKANYSDTKVKFIFSVKGTRFTDTLPPNLVKPKNVKENPDYRMWFNQNDPLKTPNVIDSIEFRGDGQSGGKLKGGKLKGSKSRGSKLKKFHYKRKTQKKAKKNKKRLSKKSKKNHK